MIELLSANFEVILSVKTPLGLVLFCYLNMPTINKTYLILSYLILLNYIHYDDDVPDLLTIFEKYQSECIFCIMNNIIIGTLR